MPSDERIAALRAGCEQNIAAGHHPYVGTRIQTLYELLWILKWHGWLGEAEYDYEPQHEYDRGPKVVRANLSGADLHEVDLTGVALVGANLTAANLMLMEFCGSLRQALLSSRQNRSEHHDICRPKRKRYLS